MDEQNKTNQQPQDKNEKKAAKDKAAGLTKKEREEIRNQIAGLEKQIEKIEDVKKIREQIADLQNKLNGGKETQRQKAEREIEEAKNIIEEIKKIPAKQRTQEQKNAYAAAMSRKKKASIVIESAAARKYEKIAEQGKQIAILKNLTENKITTENAVKELLKIWDVCGAYKIKNAAELKAALDKK